MYLLAAAAAGAIGAAAWTGAVVMLAYVAFGIVCFVWGTTYLGIAIAIETLPTFLFAGSRFALGGAILLALALMRGHKLPVRRQDWLNLAVIGVLMFVAFRYARVLLRPLGEAGTLVFLRLSAFILLCLGVQIVWEGLRELLREVWVAPPL